MSSRRYTAEELAGHIFDILSTRTEDHPTTWAQIANEVSRHVGDVILAHQIGHALEWIRDNSQALGWTVPNVRSGSSNSREYHVVAVDPSWGVSNDGAAAVEDGWRSRTEYARTTVGRSIKTLRLASEHAHSKRTKAELRLAVNMGEVLIAALDAVVSEWDNDDD